MNPTARPLILALLALAFLAGTAPPARAVINEIITFEQLTYAPQETAEPVEFSLTGQCVVEYDKDPEMGYLNLVALIPGLTVEPQWIVRNLPLASIEYGPPHEQVSVQFPLASLGAEDGFPVNDLFFGYEVRIEPLSDDEYPMWATTVSVDQVAPVMQVQADVNVRGIFGDSDELPGFPQYPDHPPYQGWPYSEVNSWTGCDMPNVPLNDGTDSWDDSACAPASCANSMCWLRTRYGLDFPGDTRNTMKQLSDLMSRLRHDGASAEDMARAKLDFIEAHNLPIHVKIHDWHSTGNISSTSGHSHATDAAGGAANAWPTTDWLFDESAAGEDVEICMGFWYQHGGTWYRKGGHAVAITGTGRIFDVPWIAWKHDADQSSDGGTEQKAGTLEDTGDGLRIRGAGGYTTHGSPPVRVRYEAYIESVVSESPDGGVTPPPSSKTFGGYCEWITRTVPPGGKLRIDCPTDTTRCMNMTVYVEDHSVRPSRKVKLGAWNHNSNKYLTVSNPYPDKCRTYHVHNDDFSYDGAGGSYRPYTVGLAVIPAGGKDDDDPPFNPDDYGGFSLGGNDGSDAEFGDTQDPTVFLDPGVGCDLSQVPRGLGTGFLTHELVLNQPIPVWNIYWEELVLVVDVLDLLAPGDLFVECQATGVAEPLMIDQPGRYELPLGTMPPQPEFMLRLEAQGGLACTFDAMGVASTVQIPTAVDDTETPHGGLQVTVYPNPFNPRATIAFSLDRPTPVTLDVFDVAGRHVATVTRGQYEAGHHEVVWNGMDADGRAVASGTYVYRVAAGGQRVIGRMTLVR